MKALFSTVLLWACILMSNIIGQDLITDYSIYTQNLNVYNQDEIVAIITGENVHTINEENQWRSLLKSFQKNLTSIQDQIPEYLIYKIEYQKDYNMIVEEVEGVVQYKVNEQQTTFAPNQSTATLKAQDFEIQLKFEKIEDLIEIDYEDMIDSAMSNLGRKPNQLKRVYFPKYNYDYSYSRKTMLDKKEKATTKFVVPVNATIGIFKGKPIYETNVGIGLSIVNEKENKDNLIYAFIGNLFQYQKEIDRMNNDMIIGAAWRIKRMGTVSVAFPVGSSFDLEETSTDIKLRISSTIISKNSTAVTLHVYLRDDEQTFEYLPSLSFGLSF